MFFYTKGGVKLFKKVVAAALAALMLVGCAGGAKNDEGGTKEAGSDRKDTVRMSMYTEIDSMNPFKMTAGDTETVMDQVFDGLFDADEKGDLVPDLAESYTVSDDGLTYVFNLKKDVKFHNGKDFKAEDVVWTYDQYAGVSSGEPKSAKFQIIKGVKALDDYTVEVTLGERHNEFIYLTLKPIMPKDYEDQDTNPVGTGPFKFVSYSPGEILVLERNDDYHKKDHIPSYKNLEIIRMKDVQTIVMALKSGDIDITPRLSQEEKAQLEGDATFVEGPQNLVQTLGLNNDVEPFNDIRVRKALNYGINRDELIETVSLGQATKVYSNFSPALPKYYVELSDLYPHDVEKAKELLKEAGYENGFNMTITVPSDYKYHMDTAEVIVSQLAEIGVNAEIEPIEFATWLTRVYKGREFQSTIVGFVGYLDPNQVLQRYKSDNKSDYINYNNPEFDAAMNEASSTSDEQVQIQRYKDAQRILAEDAASVFLVDPDAITAVRNGVEGLKLYPIQKLNLEDIVIK